MWSVFIMSQVTPSANFPCTLSGRGTLYNGLYGEAPPQKGGDSMHMKG